MTESDCVFCKIAGGELEANILHQEEGVLAFEDINGLAPVHALVIPRRHIENLEEIDALSGDVSGRLFAAVSEVAKKLGVAESGYAVRISNGPDAGQEIPHLRLHVIGGQRIEMP